MKVITRRNLEVVPESMRTLSARLGFAGGVEVVGRWDTWSVVYLLSIAEARAFGSGLTAIVDAVQRLSVTGISGRRARRGNKNQ